MDFDWRTSPLYLKYKTVCWSDDHLKIAQVIDEGLSSSNPVERAHWLNMKANQIAGRPEIPDRINRAWDTLETALATAPDQELHQFRTSLLQMALAIIHYEGPVDRAWPLLRQLQPGLGRYVGAPAVSFNIAVLYLMSGHFRQARLWLNRTFRVNYVDTKSPLGKVNALAMSAYLHALQGHPEAGAADLQEAHRLFGLHGDGRPRMYTLAMADTWMALREGRLQAARASLQEFMARTQLRDYPLYIFVSHVLAARLALAEGSRIGYRHYRDQAVVLCDEHDLTLSLGFFKAIMSEVEREVPEGNIRQDEQG